MSYMIIYIISTTYCLMMATMKFSFISSDFIIITRNNSIIIIFFLNIVALLLITTNIKILVLCSLFIYIIII